MSNNSTGFSSSFGKSPGPVSHYAQHGDKGDRGGINYSTTATEQHTPLTTMTEAPQVQQGMRLEMLPLLM